MSTVAILGAPLSPFVRAARIVCEEKGAAYELPPFDPRTLQSPEHRERHPFGRMPVMTHDDLVIYETQAILRYIDQVFPGTSLMPADARRAAAVNQALGIVDCYLFPKVFRPIVGQRIVRPLFGMEPDEAVIAAAAPDGATTLAALDRLKGDQRYVAGDQFTIADIQLGCQFAGLALTEEGRAMLAGQPRLGTYLDDLNSRDSFRKTMPKLS